MSTNIPPNGHNTEKITIRPGTDFHEEVKKEIPILAQEIINNLPEVLREGVHRLVEPNDKQVFLVSALATLSGVMPNVVGHYDGKWLAPNLYAFILGDYGSGKGAMQYARQLIEPIEAEIEERAAAILAEYAATPPEEREGTRPKIPGLVIPANASASMFLQMLDDQDGRGILFETEGDTLAQTLASDHGNYSDILRKAFHHEGTAMARRTGNERRQIKTPELSVILTGTPGQFRKLVPNAENGLFSRFLYLQIQPEIGFRDVFNKAKTKYNEEFTRLAYKVHSLYKELSQHTAVEGEEAAFEFTFTPQQQKQFTAAYRAAKPGFIDDTGNEANGVFNRLAVINFRVAMVLAVLRQFEMHHSVPPQIICTDADYMAAKALTEILTDESKDVYYMLPERKPEPEESLSPIDAEVMEVMDLHRQGLSIRKIAGKLGVSKSTVHNRIKKGGCPPAGH